MRRRPKHPSIKLASAVKVHLGGVENWLEEKKGATAPATMQFNKGSTAKFLSFLGDRAGGEISEIQRKDITAYRAHLAQAVSPSTANHDIKCLRMVFKAARRDGLVTEDPTEFVQLLKSAPAAGRRPFTLDVSGHSKPATLRKA